MCAPTPPRRHVCAAVSEDHARIRPLRIVAVDGDDDDWHLPATRPLEAKAAYGRALGVGRVDRPDVGCPALQQSQLFKPIIERAARRSQAGRAQPQHVGDASLLASSGRPLLQLLPTRSARCAAVSKFAAWLSRDFPGASSSVACP